MARAPDTLKPYQPTIRNRISTALLGDAKASSVRGRFVKGLMGDTGLSATGLGIVDLLPFLQADEAGRQLATKGQRGAGATNLALSVIPIPAVANKLVKPVAKKAAKGVARLIGDVVGEAAPTVSKIADAMEGAPMVAYHGSPKTDLSSVRTSERGALGPGAYFTPNEGVAARYAGPEGKTYAADLSGVFDGMHWPRNSSVNPYQVWRDQVAKLVEADPKRAEEIGAIAAKMQPQDGYPFFKRIAAMYGSEQDAQDLFRKAGFKGVAGHADGPEIAMFDDVPIHAPASAAPIPVPVVQPKITAYHGSPHDFDQFSLDKIGTGEGAQAYGHGLYFAENEGVAKQYRDQLSRTIGDPHSMATAQVANHGGDRAAAAQHLRANLDAERAKPNPDASWLDHYTPVLQVLESSAPVASDAGHMYQVGINADPEKFLDWDKPFSEQPPSVQGALKSFGYEGDYPHELAVQGPDINERFIFNSPKEAADEAERWRALGEYEVQGPWEARHQQPLTGERIYRDVRDQPNFRQAGSESKALSEAGIPGIKYLDGGSRGAGEGTRNFVVFDEKLITILKKYGWVPGAALPAAAIAEYTKENGSPPPTVPMV